MRSSPVPGLGPAVGLVAIFATYAVGFFARPFGGLFFGSLGDRHGRKAGAEQAGASTLMAEYAPPARRGYCAALPFVGIQVGMMLATALFIPLAQFDEDVLFGWVWRVPFLLSAVLILVAVYIRLKPEESPAFERLEESGELS
ncbi:MFS transporter [Streptomyces canus]|uniref:MFS transporter n=1 Tax=Streptomyces canus TaxID=58343 RepID=UPI0036E8A1B2